MDGRGRDEHEDRLLTRVAAGDARAFEALYDLYAGPVYSLARKMLGDPAAAQEIAQDVFEVIWRGADAFSPERGSARSWILALAHHKTVDAMRRRRVRSAEPLSETQADESDVVSEAMRGVVGAEVRSALGAISDVQRTVLVLAYYAGYTQEEISRRLGVPLGTVKTRMRDGLRRLRGALGSLATGTIE
jgi:RNA polymerase sigma-70 factor (ECF subfamily)